jgi:NifU-like protein involved in Fe-S cluster formation
LMRLAVIVRGGIIAEAKFKVEGCIPAIACGSWLTEVMVGKPPAALAGITAEQIEAALGGLPAASRHAARLAADALSALLRRSDL